MLLLKYVFLLLLCFSSFSSLAMTIEEKKPDEGVLMIMPEEILYHIFSFIKDDADLCTLHSTSLTCKKFNNISQYNHFLDLYNDLKQNEEGWDYFAIAMKLDNVTQKLPIELFAYNKINELFNQKIDNNFSKLTNGQIYLFFALSKTHLFIPSQEKSNIDGINLRCQSFIDEHYKKYPNCHSFDIFNNSLLTELTIDDIEQVKHLFIISPEACLANIHNYLPLIENANKSDKKLVWDNFLRYADQDDSKLNNMRAKIEIAF